MASHTFVPEDFCELILRQTSGGVVDDYGAVSIKDVQMWANQVCDRLRGAGLEAHEPVLVPIGARAEDVAAIIGVILAGGVAVPIHVSAHADSVAQVRSATKARYEVSMPERGATATPALVDLADAAPQPRALLVEAAMITFTSGSTGQPKGVVLSRARISAKFNSIQQKIELPEGAVTAVPLQLTFSFGQWATFITLMQGGTVLMSSRFDPVATAHALSNGACQFLAAVPTMLRMLPDVAMSASPITILTGGEAVSVDLRQRIFDQWPRAKVFSIYGLTETGTCDVFHEDIAAGDATDTLGRAAPAVSLRTDPLSSELQICTPFAMLGYLDMPEQSNETLNNGWLRSGDLATITPGGDVSFLGRLKELINRAGNKVSPLEVESLFARHPAVSATLATGVADARIGEAIHLLIVRRHGSQLSADDFREWAKPQTEPFKLPDKIYFAEALPLGRTGKADRAALRKKLESGEVVL